MIRQNIISNVIARIWGVISVYLFVPLYLKFLGIDAYGLVGFYSTLVAVFAFADMGFSATLNRQMARLTVREDSAGEMRDLLRTYETTYLCISFAVGVICWALAPLIAEHWLRSKVLGPHEMSSAIRLMGVAIALQMPTGLYTGGLMGLQKQVRANVLQVGWGAFRGFGAVLVLWLWAPTIFAFALWQLISNALYCVLVRLSLWRTLSPDPAQPRPRFKWQVFNDTWRYAAGMAGMAVVSTLLTQADKLTVSKMMTLEVLGYYTLAGALASLPLMLASPIASAVFPRLTGLVEMGDHTGLVRLYHRTCELVGVAILPVGLTVAFFAGDFVFAWTGSAVTAHRAGLVASLLLVGQLMQALTVVPFYLALAHGNIKLNILVGVSSVVLITPLLFFLIRAYGVVGAGMSWVIMNLCTLPPYMYLLHKRFVPGELRKWCLGSVVRPFITAFPFVLLGRWLAPHTASRLMSFFLIGIVAGVATAATAFAVPELRDRVLMRTRRAFGVSYGTE
ncbi:MAG TPA: oligosaccharide flippase family protein [Armatimonadota bacterium]|jgi:O-antigen/teichoic acid export membrane protein